MLNSARKRRRRLKILKEESSSWNSSVLMYSVSEHFHILDFKRIHPELRLTFLYLDVNNKNEKP